MDWLRGASQGHRRRRRRSPTAHATIACLAAACLALTPPPTLAKPTPTTPPDPISNASEDAWDPQVASTESGNAVVVWERRDTAKTLIRAARRTVWGEIGPAQTLSALGQNADDPEVAIDAHGNAIAVWRRFDGSSWRIQMRRISKAGELGSVSTLSASGRNASGPQIAMDGAGNAVVVWRRHDGSHWRIQAVRRSSAGNLTTVKTLSASGRDARTPQVAMDAGGNALVVWARHDGSNWRVQAVRRATDGSLSAVQTLSASGRNAANPQAAVDENGNAVVAWARSDGSFTRIQSVGRTADGSLGAVQTLSASGKNAKIPQVAVDPAGNAVVVWVAAHVIEARRRSPSGSLASVQTLSSQGGSYSTLPQVAIDRAGNAMVVWQQDALTDVVRIIAVPLSGTNSPVVTVSQSEHAGLGPQLALDDRGNATVVWRDGDGLGSPNYTIQSQMILNVQSMSAGIYGTSPDVAVDDTGQAIVSWIGSDGSNSRARARSVTTAGAIGPTLDLSVAGKNVDQARVAVNGSGQAILAWRLRDGPSAWLVQARRLSPDGTLSETWDIGATGEEGEGPQVAIDASGNAIVVWRSWDGANWRIVARVGAQNGEFGSTETLSDAGQDAIESRVAIDGSGNATAVWTRFEGANERVQARHLNVLGTLGPVLTLSAPGDPTIQPEVVVDADGDAVVAWSRHDGSNWRVEALAISAAGVADAVQPLSEVGTDGLSPYVDTTPAGTAVFVWVDAIGARLRTRSPSGVLSETQVLDNVATFGTSGPRVAVDDSGNAVIVWRGPGIQVRARSADGVFGRTLVPVTSASAWTPLVAVTPTGGVIVVWSLDAPGGAQVSRLPAP